MKIKKLRRIKKGMDSTQLNWVFMLIAGIIILMFFFFVVQRQRALSKEALAEKILTSLQQLFIGASVSTGATNYFETPLIRFDFTCDKDTCTAYGCGDSSFSMPEYSDIRKLLSTQPLFSAATFKGNGMTVMTKPWNVPFRVANFVYITNPSTFYLVIYEAGSPAAKSKATELYNELLPAEIVFQKGKDRRLIFKRMLSSTDTAEIDKLARIQQENMKVIYIGSSNLLNSQTINKALSNSGSKKIRSILLVSSINFGASGKVPFYTFDKTNKKWNIEGTSYYVSDSSFLGTLYAEDLGNYECNMMKALAAFSQLANLYEARRSALQANAELAGNDPCRATYIQAGELLNDLMALKQSDGRIPLDESTVKTIYEDGIRKSPGALSSLDDYNMKLQKQSCPVIY